ncbi:protein kinase, partial [Acidobacteriia bacterium AH_259_A11_L15]|nr:protein kinase [Acidobacteriia bacterium AH_259_A11_L15]
MGEVYRARDERLNRDVALKLLPEAFAQDRDRLARFQREAQVLASLNHPHIAAIHGLEESGGLHCLVLELVEGETLAERVQKGPLPVDEALKLCRQMADAVDAAHERGIIHRDLKPANVKVTPEGTVKVLDFGLAKAFEGERAMVDISKSPTLSQAATQAGVLLGTAAYMSPEQAKGKPVDKRADVWAFGCVLYELLTGKPVFAGETVTDIIAGVVRVEPDWKTLPADTPASIRKLLRRCLEKDVRRRLQAIGEARIVLEDTLAGTAEEAAAPVAALEAPKPAWRRALPWAAAAVLAVGLGLVGFSYYRATLQEARVVRSFIPAPPDTMFDLEAANPGPVAISPDGTKLAFTARDPNGEILLYVRALDSLTALPLPGTQDAAYPFWSPDGRMLGYIDTREGKLKKIAASGGPPLALCDASNGKGGAWNREGVIVFTPEAGTPLYRVAAAGGEPQALTKLNQQRGENSHRFPQFLPDGRHFLFFARAGRGENAILVGSLDGMEPKLILRTDFHARYASGHLLFLRQNTLMAQPFDPDKLEFTGDAFPIAEDVEALGGAWRGVYDVSENGVLVYRTGQGGQGTELHLVDREGKLEKKLGGDVPHLYPVFSPDGRRILV